ncbi:MAG: hypothetical protein AB7F66_09195 [Bacteriovoracia bacterium]
MKYLIVVWIAVFFLFASQARAAVRTVDASERSMTPIFLSLGRSTVLRFPEKPRKVVLGNKNYFNIEFIENDVAIQPLGVVTTNLFVYGEAHSFGFILHSGGGADDLVHVRWALPTELKTHLQSQVVQIRKIGKQFSIGKKLQLRLERLAQLRSKNLFWVEALLLSHEEKTISVKEVSVNLFEGSREVKAKWVCQKDALEPLQGNPCRLFLPNSKTGGYTLKVKYHGTNVQVSF